MNSLDYYLFGYWRDMSNVVQNDFDTPPEPFVKELVIKGAHQTLFPAVLLVRKDSGSQSTTYLTLGDGHISLDYDCTLALRNALTKLLEQ